MHIGANINKILSDKGKTPYWLSKVSGISQSYIYELLKGKYNNPSAETLLKISNALNVPINKLLKKSE